MYRCKIPALLVAGGYDAAGMTDITKLLGTKGCRLKVKNHD